MDSAEIHSLVKKNIQRTIKTNYNLPLYKINEAIFDTLNALVSRRCIKCYAFYYVTSTEVSFEYQLPWYNGPYGWIDCTITWDSCKCDTGGTQMSIVSEDGPMDVEELQEYLELLTNIAEGKESIEELYSDDERDKLHKDIVGDYDRAMGVIR